MSENVIELNKLNIFGDTDLLHHPQPWISEPPTRSQTLFHGQFPLVLIGFAFPTLSPLVTQELFLLTLLSAGVQILPGLIPFSETEGCSHPIQVLRRNTLCDWSGEQACWGF